MHLSRLIYLMRIYLSNLTSESNSSKRKGKYNNNSLLGKAIIKKEFSKRIHCMFTHSTFAFSRVYRVTRLRFNTIHWTEYINMIVIFKGFVFVAMICIVKINRRISWIRYIIVVPFSLAFTIINEITKVFMNPIV